MIRSAAEVKLAQAARRLEELDRAVRGFVATSPFSIGWEISDDRRTHSIHLQVDVLPPDHQLSPVIGEVAHNIGSALDAVAWEVAMASARVAGAQPVHDVRFPTVSTDTPTSRRRLADLLRPFEHIPRARDLIELVQPREDNGCQELITLEALWNFDKHRGIHRTAPVQLHDESASWSSFTNMPLDIEAPIMVPAARGSSATPMPVDWQPSWPVDDPWTLGFGSPAEAATIGGPSYVGLPIVKTLQDVHLAIRSRIVGPLCKILDASRDQT